jgi:hypothetical protein
MLHCASCEQNALYLREGSVFYIDRPDRSDRADESGRTVRARRTIWLCRSCSTRLRVETWRPPGEQLCVKTPGREPMPERDADRALPVAS